MIAQSLLPEFDQEMKSTRALLERVPEGDAAWTPHEKSMSLGHLAMHVANIPVWAKTTVEGSEFDVDPPDGERVTTPAFESSARLLAFFDENVANARELIAGASDETLMGMWTLKNGGETVFSIPRVAVLRTFVMNHLIHHRGQLTVYCRLRNVPLPSIYGPSADEG